jgi:hypothetical protein
VATSSSRAPILARAAAPEQIGTHELTYIICCRPGPRKWSGAASYNVSRSTTSGKVSMLARATMPALFIVAGGGPGGGGGVDGLEGGAVEDVRGAVTSGGEEVDGA